MEEQLAELNRTMSTPSPIDTHLIDITQTAELVFWVERLGATEEQIAEAIQAVGPRIEDVKRYLDEDAESKGHQPEMLDSGFGTSVS